ncbi:GDA1/CD39 nucleoside phosphatase family protein [Arabidopsis thaliana]|uniref:Probable apyrase 7 n=1 Tax=Arabidopsis thaliana TaxID=3702 RepID=APY7_ARATH|eukprot:NP_001329939.1 GDA1/CD39 nucleoside phosphatase family protein [Arabidopsis thaliana]
MVFGRITELFTAASSRLPAGSQSSVPYMPTGSSPDVGTSVSDSISIGNGGRKNCLRHSASLQDFSSYHGFDPEESILPREAISWGQNGSSFSKEKGSVPNGTNPSTRRKLIRAVMIVMCLFLFAFLVYIVSMYIYTNWSRGASRYYVVFDCGSTGTRAYVYQASINYKKDSSLPIVMKSLTEGISRKSRGRAYDRMETEPGFDKLVNNRTGLKTAIKPLIQWAEKQIPKNAHRTTSLFVYATAGVRRLRPADSSWILGNVWSILAKSPFTCRREWVKIISGTEEAYFGWTALNYQTSMLGALPKKATFGALDLGGSSLQVTFENEERTHNETNLNLRIGSVNHHLSAYSLAGYGLNDAFDRSVVHLLKKLPNVNKSDLIEGKLEMKHPCLNSGYNGQYICSQCASSVQGGKKGKSGVSIKLVGAPNWGECSALAKNAVNSSEWSNAKHGVDCDLQPCALPDGYPRPHGQFYAVSGFFVVYRFFNLSAEASLDDVLEKGREFCDKAWQVARTSVSPQPFIEQYCFRAPYIVSLLREGLYITDKQIIIGSGSITWTLGVALLESGKALSSTLGLKSYETLSMKINPIALISILILSLLLLLCALSRVSNCLPRFFRKSYLPLFRHNSTSASSVLNIPSPFRFQRWSPMSTGVKTPLSPTVRGSPRRPFSFGSSIQLMESSLYSSSSCVMHSCSSDSLGDIQYDSTGSFWSSPRRSQMRLQSRRSQSREDLSSSLADSHMLKM